MIVFSTFHEYRVIQMIYLDNAATTPVCKAAADAAYNMMLENYGNPSSTHAAGRNAKKALDTARKQVAMALGCEPSELYFTSCGSEADNWAIVRGAEAMSKKGRHVISSTVEHDAVRKSLDELERRGFEVTRLTPDESGRVTVESVKNALRADTILVSLMMVNNETGALTDISGISRMLKAEKSLALLHTDAVQGFMKVPFKANTLGADMISISGHKIHAPKGIGALYISKNMRPVSKLLPYVMGGGQESNMRAGTENLPGIAAFGAAAEEARKSFNRSVRHMNQLRDHAIARLQSEIGDVVIIGGGTPHILSVSMPGYPSEVVMNFLERDGICIAKSSACKKGGRSHVLEAIGLQPRVIDSALRISFSRFTTMEDVDALCDGLLHAKQQLFPTLG